MNSFTELYKTLSNKDLLKVLHAPTDYQAEAVEAAKAEIDSRSLTEEQVAHVMDELFAERAQRVLEDQRALAMDQKFNSLVTRVVRFIHPNLPTDSPEDRVIKRMSLLFSGLALYHGYHDVQFLGLLLTPDLSGLDFSFLYALASCLFLPIATVLFWLRRKLGWIMMTTFITYSLSSFLAYIIMSYAQDDSQLSFFDGRYFQRHSIWYFLTPFLFGGALWIVNMRSLGERFGIQPSFRWLPVLIVLLNFLVIFGSIHFSLF